MKTIKAFCLQNNALILVNVLISSGQQEHTWQIQVDCDDKKQLTQ